MTVNLTEEVARSTIWSDSGQKIEQGEVFFSAEEHGRRAVYLADEAEEMLGLAQFTAEERKSLASKGQALPDGSFPIRNCSDARNAIHAIGRANPSDRGRVRAHIRKRVRALGCSGSTFDNWK